MDSALDDMGQQSGLAPIWCDFDGFNLNGVGTNEIGQANTHLNVQDVVKKHFLNDTDIGELNNETLVLARKATINCDWI